MSRRDYLFHRERCPDNKTFCLVNRNGRPFTCSRVGETLGIVMEHLSLEIREGEVYIPGFPNAVKVVAIKSKDARRLAHFSLHLTDLRFALDMLELLSKQEGECTRIQQDLWEIRDYSLRQVFWAERGKRATERAKDLQKLPGRDALPPIFFGPT